jgi:uncharacterized protein
LEIVKNEGFHNLFDGTNADDTKDYRPGMKALEELNVKSPLLECGFSKSDIRRLSKTLGLPTWNKPAYACLLTRIPFNQKILQDELSRIEKSEVFLHQIGLKAVRVRSHGNLARLEMTLKDLNKLNEKKRLLIAGTLKSFGFTYVTIDLEGYKMGSLNES